MLRGWLPFRMAQPPVLQVKVNGQQISALLDTGCTCSILDVSVIETSHLKTQSHVVTMMNGETVSSQKIPGVLAEVGGLSL
jgi:hypothetical protein